MKGNLKVILSDKLETWELKLLYKSYDIIGNIAVIRVPEPIKQRKNVIAEAVMQTHKNVKTVLSQVGPVSGEYRLRKLLWIMGERKSETIYREYGSSIKVDLEKCYFSPRLSYERRRIAHMIQQGEVIVNMFAGVGAFSIIIANNSEAEKIYSIDINPSVVKYMQENVKLNKLEERVLPILGDAKRVIEEGLRGVADRVLMPLPERAHEYLDYSMLALKPYGGWIHYYDFEHAERGEDPIKKTEIKISKKIQEFGVKFEVVFGRIVRGVGPNWFQIVLDIKVKD